jgi:diguanylate cyclase (GGDEF)-like protein
MVQAAVRYDDRGPIDRLSNTLRDEAEMFHLAPVSLWLEDFSGVKKLFAAWRSAGVTSLRDYLAADVSRIQVCSRLIRVVSVNRETLNLFGARDLQHLVENLDTIFRDEMLAHHIEELAQLWDGHTEFKSHTVNYALSGRRIDVQLKGSILPGYEEDWSRVLLAVEDVSERETAQRDLAASESYARGLFQHSPISLWVEDFSAIKILLDEAREQGISDFRVFVDVHPEFVERCMSEIRVLDVNRHTLEMFAAPDMQTLLARLNEVFRDDMAAHFKEQLIDLWHGKLFQLREAINYRLDGKPVNVHMQFSVFPGHEDDWSLVQVALTDITARKKAEAYLEYLGKHDVLTKLYNRSFYVDEMTRLERKMPAPVTIVIADLNGLKDTNDRFGHAAGDHLLQRVGEVLNKAIAKPCYAARIGGDEFAILLPATDERQAQAIVETVQNVLGLNNQFYSSAPITLSIGLATSEPGESLEETARRADAEMYKAKREYYRAEANRRRLMTEPETPAGA